AAGERFGPTDVETFVGDANLETRDATGGFTLFDPAPEALALPTSDTALCQAAGLQPCWRLNQRACSPLLPIGGLGCYAASVSGDAPSVVYGRVAEFGNRIVLQYWFFYYDDVYSYQDPPTDFIWQAHEGDWEVVIVVLSGD